MRNDFLGGINAILELIRSKKYQEAQERVSKEKERFTQVEVRERRRRVDALIQSIVQIDVQIQTITNQMMLIDGPGAKELNETIKDFVIELKAEKARLQTQKRVSARAK